ncbi:MAG: cupin domain-containing protein [Terrimicrobiaceae bacterium]|nr:cupin domain-containing protein [Terrimicrobiaceae bacterium]
MILRSLASQKPFITADGSEIRSLLDRSNAPVVHQSLAEARLPAGGSTTRHFHRAAEEFYYVLEGRGLMEIGGETAQVGPGDAILIPPGAWHRIEAIEPMRFLCCCAPPYSHDDTFFE